MDARFAISILVGFTTALVACDAGRSELAAISRRTTDEPGDPLPYGGQQGTALVGGYLEGQHLAWRFGSALDADHQSFDSVHLDGTELVAIRDGQEYRGHQLEGVTFMGHGLDMIMREVTIDAFFVHRDPHRISDSADYRVTLVGYGDLCNGLRAMPIGGTWSEFGEHLSPDTVEFTFACADGVMSKCIDFGFKPWVDRLGTSIAGVTQTLNGRMLHQTCTRMARADYCADGRSHTMNDTWIHYYDIFDEYFGLSPTEPMPTVHRDRDHPDSERYNMYFEAAWRPGIPPPPPKQQSAAICLSKKRWSTIPFDGYCAPGVLPDPRTPDGKTNGARFCDEDGQTEANLEAAGALLFNDSAFVDLGLFRWGPNASGYYFTTSAFVDFWLRPEFTTSPDGFLSPARVDGAVFNHTTRWIPQGLIPLCSFIRGASDYLTTTSTNCVPPDPMWQFDAMLGSVYPATYSDGVPLYLYRDPGDPIFGPYITTTEVLAPPYTPIVIGKLPHR